MPPYKSFFTYNTQESYPFRWYTPVTLGLGAAALAVCTLINMMAQGFNLVTIVTAQPVADLQGGSMGWLQKGAAFLAANSEQFCEVVRVPVGSQVMAQRAFWYNLRSVARPDVNGVFIPSTELVYMYDQITDCMLDNIVINVESQEQKAQQLTRTEWNPIAQASVHCNITNTWKKEFDSVSFKQYVGPWRLNMTIDYTYMPEDVAVFPYAPTDVGLFHFALGGAEAIPSLTWGCSLTSMFWTHLSQEMNNVSSGQNPSDAAVQKGALHFKRDLAITDVTDPGFYKMNSRFFDSSGQVSTDSVSKAALAGIGAPADSFAKVFYSSILSDLGISASRPGENLLASLPALKHFTANTTQIIDQIKAANLDTFPGPLVPTPDLLPDKPFDINSTYLDTEFVCHVTRMKSPLEIVINVFVQDLVMLRALYSVWTWIVAKFFLKDRRMVRSSMLDESGALLSPQGDPLTPNPIPGSFGGYQKIRRRTPSLASLVGSSSAFNMTSAVDDGADTERDAEDAYEMRRLAGRDGKAVLRDPMSP